MIVLALLLIGYSLFTALVLGLTQFGAQQFPGQLRTRVMGCVVLVVLAGLQAAHFALLWADKPWVLTPGYSVLLCGVAPGFFLFASGVLGAESSALAPRAVIGHLAPVVLVPWLAPDVALPLAFGIGAGYLLWLARRLWALRSQRANFGWELGLLGLAVMIAALVVGWSFLRGLLSDTQFFAMYSIAIGLALLLVQLSLALRPHLGAEVQESAQALAYAVTTLGNVDCDTALVRLQELMGQQHRYRDPDLSLAALAQDVGLSAHQVSELVNTRLGKGFSRYLREQRIAAAKQMLCKEPSASVLSVGLNVGFTSQSNFYEAFREVEGTTPGQYRKLALRGEQVNLP